MKNCAHFFQHVADHVLAARKPACELCDGIFEALLAERAGGLLIPCWAAGAASTTAALVTPGRLAAISMRSDCSGEIWASKRNFIDKVPQKFGRRSSSD